MEKNQGEKAALKFLRSGKREIAAETELAQACERVIQKCSRRSHAEALKLAVAFARRTSTGGRILRLSAQRTLARMAHLSGLHKPAAQAYLRARQLIKSDPLLRGRIDRALIDVYMYLGRYDLARKAARRATNTFSRLKEESDLIQTRVNYANLLHRLDRHREAEQLYRSASEFFERTGHLVATARCYYNRANTLVQLFDLKQAEDLYRRSEKLYESEGHQLDANDARYGRAWLKMLVGDYHIALTELSACEARYRVGGDTRGEALCILDRAEVFLSLGLYRDALQAARESWARFKRLRSSYESGKAALFRGQAAWMMGKKTIALKSFREAHTLFTREKNDGFTGVTRFLAASLIQDDERIRKREIEAARKMFSRIQLPLWEAICDLYSLSEASGHKQALKNLARNKAVRIVPHLYAYWQTARGDYEISRGRKKAAIRHWIQAADRLDAVRAKLPPLELRSVYSRRFSSPHLRLVAAELEGNALAAAVWAERYRTSGLWSSASIDQAALPVRQKIQETLDNLARNVAALSHYFGGHPGKGSASRSATFGTIPHMQKEIREYFIALETISKHEAALPSGLAEAFENTSHILPIVQFHVQGEDIIAFVHNRGKTRAYHIYDGKSRLQKAMERWRFILEGILLADHFKDVGFDDAEKLLWTDLGEWLWKPLGIDSRNHRILILPEGELANIPWSALIIDGEALIDRHQIVIAPSLRHYLAACRRESNSDNIEIFQGSMDYLSPVDNELELIRQRAGVKAVIHHSARRENWPDSGSSFIWHFIGHANLRADNPFYSHLVMNDGPLFAADFRLKDCTVDVVTLAACCSGKQVALPGEESTGLVRSLLEMGARNVISSYWPVSDKATGIWMKSFYRGFLEREPILDAVQQASQQVREILHSAYYWAAFSVSGAGESGGYHGI